MSTAEGEEATVLTTEADTGARLRALERRYLLLLYAWWGLAALAVGACLVLALRTSRSVSARRFLLIDSTGAVRGEWGPSEMIAGESNGKPVVTPTTCLEIRGGKGAYISQCVPWNAPGPSMLTISHPTGAKASLQADAFNAQALLSARVLPTDTRPTTLAYLGATHVGPALSLRHGTDTLQVTPRDGLTRTPKGDTSPR